MACTDQRQKQCKLKQRKHILCYDVQVSVSLGIGTNDEDANSFEVEMWVISHGFSLCLSLSCTAGMHTAGMHTAGMHTRAGFCHGLH